MWSWLTPPPGLLPPDYSQLATTSTNHFTQPHISSSYRDDTGLLPKDQPTPAYLHSLRLLNDDLYLTSYPSLPPRNHDLSPSNLLDNMSSFPYSPINDFDLTRNVYTKHLGNESTPGLTYRSTLTMPHGHEINALRHYQRQLLQQRAHPVPQSTSQPSSSPSSPPPPSIPSQPLPIPSSPLFQVVESALNTFLPLSTAETKLLTTTPSIPAILPAHQDQDQDQDQLDPTHRSAYDGVGAHFFSPSISSPHLYSYALSSSPSLGAQFSTTLALKNKLLCHFLLKQNPQQVATEQTAFNQGTSISQTLSALTNTTPSADFIFLTQLTPRAQASVRLYDIGPDGVGQAALSVGSAVNGHNLNFTIQSRPTYLYLPQFPNQSSSSSTSASPRGTPMSTHFLPTSTTAPLSTNQPSTSIIPSLSSPSQLRHPSDTLVDALAAGLNHECPHNINHDIQSWRLSGDIGLTPLERMILDKPVLHFTITRNVKPVFTTSPLAQAQCGLRLSASSYFPHWFMNQQNPATTNTTTQAGSIPTATSNTTQTAIAPFSSSSTNFTPHVSLNTTSLKTNGSVHDEPSLLDPYYLTSSPALNLQPSQDLSHPSFSQPQSYASVPPSPLFNLLASIGTIFVQKSPTNQFSFETTDSLSSLRASYTHFFDPRHTVHNSFQQQQQQQQQQQTPESSLNHALFTTTPKLIASVSIEMNLKQLRASQIALYEQFHYHHQKKHLEYLRQMTMDYLQSVGSGPKTPVVNPVPHKPQPQPHSLPLPTIPLAQSHPYIFSPTALRALLYATTTELSNTYFIQSSVAYNFSHAAQVSMNLSSHGDLGFNAVLSSHPTPLSKCVELCPTCNHRRCDCFQGLDPLGVPIKLNLGVKTNLNSTSPLQTTNISFSTTLGNM